MTTPKMILFDYGHTLLYEPDYDTLRGFEALFRHVESNRDNRTPAEVNRFSQQLYGEIGAVRQAGFDLHETQFQQLLYEYLGIEFTIPYPKVERVFCDGTSPGAVMPGAEKMLAYLSAHGIRSGVISNIGFSGAALTERIDRLLPGNRFEFVIASSEYMFRKPSRYLFELALRKAGLDASEAWFCGDSVRYDVEGAAAAGLFPVWYDNQDIENLWNGRDAGAIPACECLHIRDWSELTDRLDQLYQLDQLGGTR